MTTEELEKKLKINENTCIHCPTLELAKQVLNIFHQLGLKWCNGTHYTTCTNWSSNKENTVYHPFDGQFSSLDFASLVSYKIISAEEFIVLHTKKEKFNLENYIPKGQLEGFPKEIIARMLECQEKQGNPRDVTVFEDKRNAGENRKGFAWNYTKEGYDFWEPVINKKNFNLFFGRYPKKENNQDNQEFRVGDKVYDIMCKSSGIITNVNINAVNYPLTVELENGKIINTYNIDGILNSYFKTPQLLHYREDYNYDIIDFNNLPKHQEPKRWRAVKGNLYYFVDFKTKNCSFSNETKDDYVSFDNDNYNSGNYFRTEVEAQSIVQKLNEHFKQLIQEEHEHKRI